MSAMPGRATDVIPGDSGLSQRGESGPVAGGTASFETAFAGRPGDRLRCGWQPRPQPGDPSGAPSADVAWGRLAKSTDIVEPKLRIVQRGPCRARGRIGRVLRGAGGRPARTPGTDPPVPRSSPERLG